MEGEKEVIDALSAHDKREHQKKQREEAHEQKDVEKELKQRNKNYFWIIITIISIIAFAGIVGWLYSSKKELYTDREIHWHVSLDITLCGEHKDLPRAEGDEIVHGKAFKGIHMLHTHDDNVIHIEGLIEKKEDIALGRFFDVIEVPFDKDKIFDKKNGDLCPDGRPGVLKMYVNNQPRTDFREFIPSAVEDARKQIVKLVFEPEEGNIANSSS